MTRKSAGILLYRFQDHATQVLLVHPGGPFWAKKDPGAWSIPKGEFNGDEAPLDAAIREVQEELGITVSGRFIPLAPQKLKSGKFIYAWAVEGDFNAETIHSNTFEMEWPPKSGKKHCFPEVDEAQWFDPDTAIKKINPGQVGFIREFTRMLQ